MKKIIQLLTFLCLSSCFQNDTNVGMNYANYRKAFEPILGCMDQNAVNFDATYEVEDGSCSFAWCAEVGFEETNLEYEKNIVTPYLESIKKIVHHHTGEGIKEYSGELIKDACHTILGCMNKKGSNFNPLANKENGRCEFHGCPLIDLELKSEFALYKEKFPEAVLDNNCPTFRGCIEKRAINFQKDKLLPNETCRFRGCPQLDEELKTDYTRYKLEFPSAEALINTCPALTGCMEKKAYNFDSKKKIADATCKFKGCPTLDPDLGIAYDAYKIKFPKAATLENTCNTHTGCMEPKALNFEKDKLIPDDSCKFRGCTILDQDLKVAYRTYLKLFPTAAKIQNTCPSFRGCLNNNALNFDKDKQLENGKCDFSWCSKLSHENTDVTFRKKVDTYLDELETLKISYTGEIKDEFNCGLKLGCMNARAKNFDSQAGKENGTCSFEGCPIFDPDLGDAYDTYKKRFVKAKLQNTCPGQQSETFTQSDRPHIGILWVVDNSGSMGNDQTNLANNFDSFIRGFLDKNFKFTMGITTTDSKHNNLSMLKLTSEKAKTDKNQFIADFKSMIKVGTVGSAKEQGLWGAHSFLSIHEDTLLSTSESPLSVIYVSDEPDQSLHSVAFHHAELLKRVSKASQLHVSAIVGTTFAKYRQMADLTNGLKLNINDTNFASHLSKISDDLVNLVDLFKLQNRPFAPSIKVFVDNQEVNDWTYNTLKNAIEFTNAPEFNSVVEVRYLVK